MLQVALALFSSLIGPHKTRVAIVGNYSSRWTSESACTTSHARVMACNAEMYAAVVKRAALGGAELVLFPEGYALNGGQPWGSYNRFEPKAAAIGNKLCYAPSASRSPQQRS